jgi:hypothetical protein
LEEAGQFAKHTLVVPVWEWLEEIGMVIPTTPPDVGPDARCCVLVRSMAEKSSDATASENLPNHPKARTLLLDRLTTKGS